MTGREGVEAALSPRGAEAFPVVIPYESIMVRDHWEGLTRRDWWDRISYDLGIQIDWRSEVLRCIPNDFLELPAFNALTDREAVAIECWNNQVVAVDSRTGESTVLEREPIGGFLIGNLASDFEVEARSSEDIDSLAPPLDAEYPQRFMKSGRGDLAMALVEEHGQQRYPIFYVGSPLWECYRLWGFEPLMRNIASAPDLVHYACRRYLDIASAEVRVAAALGAAGIWIEECLTDMISPESYRTLCLPYLGGLIEEIRGQGMGSILYFCGDPEGKLELILSANPDAVGFEESKKDFRIDIDDLAEFIDGRCGLLGNIDAIEIVERGSEDELRGEISRQIEAGRRNRGRFVMSTGSPITPATSVGRVQLYFDLARELGAGAVV